MYVCWGHQRAGRQPDFGSWVRKAIYLSANDLRKGSKGFLSLALDDMGCWCLLSYVSHPSPHNDSDNQLHFWSLGGTGKIPVMAPAREWMETHAPRCTWTLHGADHRLPYTSDSCKPVPTRKILICFFKGLPDPKMINNSCKQHWPCRTGGPVSEQQ